MKMFAVMNVYHRGSEPTAPVRLPAKRAGEVAALIRKA
jgi:hypothetical protein